MSSVSEFYVLQIGRLDFDCEPADKRNSLILHFVDTYIAANLNDIRELAWATPDEARIRLCELVAVLKPAGDALKGYRAEIQAEAEAEAKESPAHLAFSARLWARTRAHEREELVERVGGDIEAVHKFLQAFANDNSLPINKAASEACREL